MTWDMRMKVIVGLLAATLVGSVLRGDVPPPDETTTLYGKLIELRSYSEDSLSTAKQIVFFADGFTEGEKETFLQKVNTLVSSIGQYTPFAEYMDHFAFYSIFVASNESGVDDGRPTPTVFKDTFFNGGIGTTPGGSDSLGVWGDRGSECLDAFLLLNAKGVYMLNTLEGRANTSYGSSSVYMSMGYGVGTLAHELGHSIGHLADEYNSSGGSTTEAAKKRNIQKFTEAEITAGIQPEDIKWFEWLTSAIALPTVRDPGSCSLSTDIGLFEGGAYQAKNYFRPACKCLMRGGSTASAFCPICREALTYFIVASNVYPEKFPANSEIQVSGSESSVDFSVDLEYPSTVLEFGYEWYVNTSLVENSNSPNFTLNRSLYGWLPVRISVKIYIKEIDDSGYIQDLDIYDNVLQEYTWSILRPKWWFHEVWENSEDPEAFHFTGPVPFRHPYTHLNDDSPVVLGQLKNFAVAARGHLIYPYYLESETPNFGRPGAEIDNMINGFLQPQSLQNPANYSPVTLGQLKAVAKPFYDRLNALGYDTRAMLISRGYPSSWPYIYPWDPTTPVSENYALATIGQLKLVFYFEYKP